MHGRRLKGCTATYRICQTAVSKRSWRGTRKPSIASSSRSGAVLLMRVWSPSASNPSSPRGVRQAFRPADVVNRPLKNAAWGFEVWGFEVWGFEVWGFEVWGFEVLRF